MINFTDNQLNEINRIIEIELTKFSIEDQKVLAMCDEQDMALLHISYGIQIRNDYLWHNDLFTQNPDDISNYIIDCIVKECKKDGM